MAPAGAPPKRDRPIDFSESRELLVAAKRSGRQDDSRSAYESWMGSPRDRRPAGSDLAFLAPSIAVSPRNDQPNYVHA